MARDGKGDGKDGGRMEVGWEEVCWVDAEG